MQWAKNIETKFKNEGEGRSRGEYNEEVTEYRRRNAAARSMASRRIINSPYPTSGGLRQSTREEKNGYSKDREWPRNMRRMTDREFQEKRNKGLCYRCDERWSVGHLCKKKELSVLLVHGDEEKDSKGNIDEALEDDTPVSVSLNTVVGLSNQKTMRLLGKIEGTEVII